MDKVISIMHSGTIRSCSSAATSETINCCSHGPDLYLLSWLWPN